MDRPVTIIAGLGNPGAKYNGSRHNAGFMVIDALTSSASVQSRERFQAHILEIRSEDETIVFMKPLTFMNDSGNAVSQVVRWYKAEPDRVLIVYDDLDLPFGSIRLRARGSAGGHNGLASVIQKLGTQEIPRLRVGIGRPASGSTVNYVLSRFTPTERAELPGIIDRAVLAVNAWRDEGIESAMNTYNRLDRSELPEASERTHGAGS